MGTGPILRVRNPNPDLCSGWGVSATGPPPSCCCLGLECALAVLLAPDGCGDGVRVADALALAELGGQARELGSPSHGGSWGCRRTPGALWGRGGSCPVPTRLRWGGRRSSWRSTVWAART